MKRFLFTLASVLMMFEATADAAPIGIPGATAGANKSIVGTEVNFLFDRDLAGPGEIESLQAYAKGEIGINERVDLIMRLGFGQFDVDPGDVHSNIGPAFGVGFKTTWAAIPDAKLKIGSVAQTVRLRAKDGGDRLSFTEYDLAIGGYVDAPIGRTPRAGEVIFLPYGGLVFSGVDVNGGAAEENAFGLFMGLAMRMGGNVLVGVELRIPEQTALAVQASVAF